MAQCVHYFEWRTYAACKKDKYKPNKEVCLNCGLQLSGQDVCMSPICDVCADACDSVAVCKASVIPLCVGEVSM